MLISERALLQRLNRRLADEGKEVRKTRGIFAVRELGDFYICNSDTVLSDHINLQALARKLDCIMPYEELAED